MTGSQKYSAFISYPPTEKRFAVQIQRSLKRIGRKWYLLGKRKIIVCRDQTDMNLTSSLPSSIETDANPLHLMVFKNRF